VTPPPVIPISFFIVGTFALGMALSFYAADPNSPTSRALAATFGMLGVTMLLNLPLEGGLIQHPGNIWAGIFSLLEAGIVITAEEWILRIGRTETGPEARSSMSPALLRVGQALAAAYGLIGVALPVARRQVWQAVMPDQPVFYLFAIPFFVSLALASGATIHVFRSKIDRAEKVRLRAMAAATPFLAAATLVPQLWKPATIAIGETVFLIGAIRYHVLQGQRAQFLARFLSPQLVRMVRERGLAGTMQQDRVQLSIMACDLRGFTAFAETAAPEDVIHFLREYYEMVGQAVTDSGGSILGFAGDGVVALVGAPITMADHAHRAVAIALEVRNRFHPMLDHWSRLGLQLGLGVGIASGFVTVGTIGSSDHLEYTAVGPPVNLAARLSSYAEAGQVLVDQRTIGLIGENNRFRFESFGSADLKGFARPVPLFSADAVAPASG
jgi:adenylate cyclase